MILQYRHLHRQPTVFRAMTGLAVAEFDALAAALLPRYQAAERARLSRPDRRRAIGAGRQYASPLRDHLLMAVVWLRRYPTSLVLGSLFGVSEYVALRAVRRVVPLLEAAGRDRVPAGRRLPDPGRGRRRDLDALLAETPELAV